MHSNHMNGNELQFEELRDCIGWEQNFSARSLLFELQNEKKITSWKRIDGKVHVDYMRLRASSEKKPFYFFTLGHSTENLHFYKNLFIVCNKFI